MDDTVAQKTRLNRFGAIVLVVLVILGLYVTQAIVKGPSIYALRFNPFAILSLMTVVLNIVLIAVFTRKPARTDERIWLTAYTLTLAIFCAAEMMQRLSANAPGAIFWHNVEAMGVMVGSMLYLFVFAYTSRTDRRFDGTIATVLIAAPMLTFYFNYTDLIFPHAISAWVQRPWGWDYNIRDLGQGIWFDFLWFNGWLILTLERLINFYRHTRNPVLRRQAVLFMLGSTVPFVLGTTTDIALPFFGINILPLALTFESFGAAMFIFATLRYQLLNISPTLFSNTILGIMDESVVATDRNLNIIFVNTKAEQMLGMKNDALGNANILKLVADKQQADFHQAFGSVNRTDDSFTLAHVDVDRPHTAAVPVRVIASRLRIAEQDTWVLVLTDITDELRTRSIIEHEVQVRTRELHEARAYLVSSINSLEQGFVLVNQQAKVELLNEEASKLFAQSVEGATDKPAAEVLPKDWNANIGIAIDRALEARRARKLDISTGSGTFYQVYITPVLAGSQVLGATVIIQDVTEAKILERSKDEFFSIASHELRTPLTAIRGNMSMAKDYFAKELKDPTLKGLVDDSHDASVRLIGIVNDFLDSSSLEQGKMIFDLAPVAVGPLMIAVRDDLKILGNDQRNTVKLEGLDSLPPVMADERRLRQILYNLLSNAHKYAQNSTITISGVTEGANVRIRVGDTGKGIAPENQKLLFHKFQQAGTSILTRDNTKGTGLGLYISKLLATNMHGTVELEHTEEGKGSIFAVILPKARKDAAKTEVKASMTA